MPRTKCVCEIWGRPSSPELLSPCFSQFLPANSTANIPELKCSVQTSMLKSLLQSL